MGYPLDSIIHLLNNWCWVRRNKLDQRFCLRPSSHSAGRIFDRLKNLIGHFVQMGPFNILALFTRNFETSKNSSSNVLIFVRLRWLHVNGTSKRTNFSRSKIRPGQCERSLRKQKDTARRLVHGPTDPKFEVSAAQ